MLQTGKRYGMLTMEEDIQSLRDSGTVTEAEARKGLLRMSDEAQEAEDSRHHSQQLQQKENFDQPVEFVGSSQDDDFDDDDEAGYSF
jgi:hypothetical protein